MRQARTALNPVLPAVRLASKEEFALKTVRIWFKKTGAARFISHLDLNRCMARAVHMAKIPLWYTQGFNPHAFITFALPLSLGMTGERESMDMKIDETKITNEEILSRLNKALPGDLRVFAVTEPKLKPGKIAFASYTLCMEPETGSVCQLRKEWEQFLSQEKIITEKKSKSGMLTIDIKPDIRDMQIREENGKLVSDCILPAGSEYNVNPALLVEAFRKETDQDFYCEYIRHGLYDASMRNFE